MNDTGVIPSNDTGVSPFNNIACKITQKKRYLCYKYVKKCRKVSIFLILVN